MRIEKPSNEDLQLISIADAARLLNVSRVRLMRWIREGKIPAVNIGFDGKIMWRIRRMDLAGFIEGNKKFYVSGEADDTP